MRPNGSLSCCERALLVRFFTRAGTRGRSGRFFRRRAMLGRFDVDLRAPPAHPAGRNAAQSIPKYVGHSYERLDLERLAERTVEHRRLPQAVRLGVLDDRLQGDDVREPVLAARARRPPPVMLGGGRVKAERPVRIVGMPVVTLATIAVGAIERCGERRRHARGRPVTNRAPG